ncbi:putative ribonuclease H-like domain-containing protein [Tanacetum coccineum]
MIGQELHKNDMRDSKQTHLLMEFYTEINAKEAHHSKEVELPAWQSVCSHSNPTVTIEDPIIRRNQRSRSKAKRSVEANNGRASRTTPAYPRIIRSFDQLLEQLYPCLSIGYCLDDGGMSFVTKHLGLTPLAMAYSSNFQSSARDIHIVETLKNKGNIDSGCSRHIDREQGFLADFKTLMDGSCCFGRNSKNRDVMNYVGLKLKGIKREYSNARTPQQNGVAERKNRTLIEAARTMLADSFLPNTFWAEAVSTACYVLNRVLVTKPHNKTPYELLTGKTPIISYIRPFGCHVTILNTIDHLGKFVGKSDEGFLVGYSLQSKAFRVYNLVTKRVEENLHINFLENKPNVAGKGPNWLFDLDYLTDSMNYLSVSSENQANIHAGQQESNQNAGTKDKIVAGDSEKEDESAQDCFEVPFWHSYSSTNTSSSKSDKKRGSPREEEQVFLDDLARLQRQEKEANEEAEALTKNLEQENENLVTQAEAAKTSGTNIISTVSTTAKASGTNFVNTVSIPVGTASANEGLSISNTTNSQEDDYEIPPLVPLGIKFLQTLQQLFEIQKMDGLKVALSLCKMYEESKFSSTRFPNPKSPKTVYKVVKGTEWLPQAPRACMLLESLRILTSQVLKLPVTETIDTQKALVKDRVKPSDVDVHLYRSCDLLLNGCEQLQGLTISVFSLCFLESLHLTWNPTSDSDYAEQILTGNPQQEVVNFLAGDSLLGNVQSKHCGHFNNRKPNRLLLSKLMWQNPYNHSKTKHIAIRHHFIRDAYEKKLIQFKSKKIAQVVRARIQGKNSLVKHFEDMRLCRPSKEYLQVWFNPPRDGSMSCLTTKGMRTIGPVCARRFRESLRRVTDGAEAFLILTLFILCLDKVSTDHAKLVPLGQVCTAKEDIGEKYRQGYKV